jgi:hypothetical protein
MGVNGWVPVQQNSCPVARILLAFSRLATTAYQEGGKKQD